MNVILLQDEIYLPSLGGATKANRYLLQALARGGHTCVALTRALTRSPDGPRDERQHVFPPDLGQCAQNLARVAARYQPRVALDMGCGTGYLALMLHRQGVSQVWASDVHPPAVACARKNVNRNAPQASVQVIHSDLFHNVPASIQFDLIVFNQPFGPGRGDTVCGCGPDGGSNITRRFLLAAPSHLSPQGVILMAFSDRVPEEHSPRTIAEGLGYHVQTVLRAYYGEANNCPADAARALG